jgi:hypothetical protein
MMETCVSIFLSSVRGVLAAAASVLLLYQDLPALDLTPRRY